MSQLLAEMWATPRRSYRSRPTKSLFRLIQKPHAQDVDAVLPIERRLGARPEVLHDASCLAEDNTAAALAEGAEAQRPQKRRRSLLGAVAIKQAGGVVQPEGDSLLDLKVSAEIERFEQIRCQTLAKVVANFKP